MLIPKSNRLKEKKRYISIVDRDDVNSDIAYWREKTPEDRLSAVEFLREQYYLILGFDDIPRISKTVNVV
jgi:hypothetical protein